MITINVPDFMLEWSFWASVLTWIAVVCLSLASRVYIPRGIWTSACVWGAFMLGMVYGVRIERLGG